MVIKFKIPSLLCTKFKFTLLDLRLWKLKIEHFKFLLWVQTLYGRLCTSLKEIEISILVSLISSWQQKVSKLTDKNHDEALRRMLVK